MRWALHRSTAPADVTFVQKLDHLRCEQMKSLTMPYADASAEQLVKIEAAQTLIDIHNVFVEMVDKSTPASQ